MNPLKAKLFAGDLRIAQPRLGFCLDHMPRVSAWVVSSLRGRTPFLFVIGGSQPFAPLAF